MKRSIALICIWLASVGVIRAVNPALPSIPTNIFNVTDFGAMGDGVKDNTTNIQNAINAANAAGGGVVAIPAGTFLSGPITLLSSVNLRVDTNAMLQMLPLGTYPGGTTNAQTFLGCSGVHDVEISGWGRIDGQGAAWWTYFATNDTLVRPMMLNLFSCDRLFIHDITFQNPPYHHCGLRSNGGNVTISNLTVNTPNTLPSGIHAFNTDGLNFVGTNCLIENCYISDGDDNIAMGATGPLDGLLITNCFFGTGHGVSIGSGISVGVSNLTVADCTFSGTVYGIRMKADTNSGGIVQNLKYLNLGMTNIGHGAITIYSYYNEYGTPTRITPATAAGEAISPVNGTTPVWRNITFSNLTATIGSSGVAGIIWGRTELPVTNVVMNHVNITAWTTFDIYNAYNIQFLDSQINTGSGKTFTIWNANVIVSNAVLPANVVTFDGLGGNTNNSFALYKVRAAMTSTDAFGANPITMSGSVLTNTGNLTLSGEDVVNFALGTNHTTITVLGNLNLNATIKAANAAGFTSTNYTLFTYTGSLSGHPVLGSIPGGYDCVLDTNTAGQVKLVSTYTGIFPTSTTTTIQSSVNPSHYGTAITFTAVVNPAPTNGETVIFKDGGSVLGTGTLTDGEATFETTASQLTLGYHSIAAFYPGDHAYATSASEPWLQTVNPPAGTYFADIFGSSTVSASLPMLPIPFSTSYEILSGKPWNPTPSIASGNLAFGIGVTSSGVVEAQARFATPGVTLVSAGDFVQLSVTFTNTAGILSQSGFWGFGLYDSGGASPIGGGLNATMSTTYTNAATGGAQNWQGYFAQIGYTGGSSGFYDREKQTGTANNNQDLVTSGTSSSPHYPAPLGIGTSSTAPSVSLTVGAEYTEVLTYTLTSSNTLELASQLYTGADTNGTLLSTMTANTGTPPLTTVFDGLAFGWRAMGSTPSTMTVSSISVTGQGTQVAPMIGYTFSGSTLALNWPTNYFGWLLQSNASALASGDWSTVPGSSNAADFFIPIDPARISVFYRLAAP